MSSRRRLSAMCAVVTVLFGAGACRVSGADAITDKEGAEREAKLAAALADSSLPESEPIGRWFLPPVLREVSGLTIVADGRVLMHGDERGVIWEVDYRRGVLLKEFKVGSPVLVGDYEGITNVDSTYFLLGSNGDLYEFGAGENNHHVQYTKHDSNLGKECEFEGVAYDKTNQLFLLACKRNLLNKDNDDLLIYRWRLGEKADAMTPLTVPIAELSAGNDWKKLNPSDIAVDPTTGNYVLVANQQKALIVITPDGKLVRAESLPKGHDQPEGVAISRDGVLIVTDEAGTLDKAKVTLYRWRR